MPAHPAISNIQYTMLSEYSQFISWQTRDARYHINLSNGATEYDGQEIYKNSLPNHGEPGYYNTRRLDGTKDTNAKIIAQVMDIVKRGDMIGKAKAAYHLEQARLAADNEALEARRKTARGLFKNFRRLIDGNFPIDYTLNRTMMDSLLSYDPDDSECE